LSFVTTPGKRKRKKKGKKIRYYLPKRKMKGLIPSRGGDERGKGKDQSGKGRVERMGREQKKFQRGGRSFLDEFWWEKGEVLAALNSCRSAELSQPGREKKKRPKLVGARTKFWAKKTSSSS